MPVTTSYTKLVRMVRRGKLHEANVLFADIMAQKSADRLAEERKGILKEEEERCPSKDKSGAQCALKPGHEGKHQMHSGHLHKMWEEKRQWWRVLLNGKEIDSMDFPADMDADDVKKSLVNHDGYDPNIKVTKR